MNRRNFVLLLTAVTKVTYLVAIYVAVKGAHCTAQAVTVCTTMFVSKLEYLHPHPFHQRSFSRDILTENIFNDPFYQLLLLLTQKDTQIKRKRKNAKVKFSSR